MNTPTDNDAFDNDAAKQAALGVWLTLGEREARGI